MAHYRFTLFVITCMACLGSLPSLGQGTEDLVGSQKLALPDGFPVGKPVKYTLTGIDPKVQAPGEYARSSETRHTGIASSRQRPGTVSPSPNLTGIATQSELVTQNSPSTPKPKPPKSKTSSSRVTNAIRTILRHKSLLILTFAALVITGAAVFILLKLVSDESETSPSSNSPSLQGHQSSNLTPSPQKLGTPLTTYSLESEASFQGTNPFDSSAYSSGKLVNSAADDSSLFLFDPEAEGEEREATETETNSHTLHSDSYNNGYNQSSLNLSEPNSLVESSGKNTDFSISKDPILMKLGIVEKLIQDLQDPNPVTRRKAIWELGRRGDSRAVEPLVKLLAESDSKQHSLILASLSEIGIRLLKPVNRALSISLQSEKADVRKNAIRDLIRIYELVVQIMPLLQRAADDSDAEVQETARWALSQFNHSRPRLGQDNFSGWQNFGGDE